jgi:hypothetical protein
MGAHSDAVAGVFADHASHFGDTDNVVVTPPSGGGDATTVTAVVGPETKADVADDAGGKRLKMNRTVLIATADVAAIGARYTLTIGGVEYSVEDVPQDSGGFWVVAAVRYGRMDARRRNFSNE